MILIFKKEKAKHFKHKVKELKELAMDLYECLEAAAEEGMEEEGRYRARGGSTGGGGGYSSRYEDYEEEDDYREMARGRSRARGRY